MEKSKFSVRDLCHIGVFTAIIAVLAQISIPLPSGVPITLQTFAVMVAGYVLGPKKGALAALVYVLLGAVGVPVFANFTGGFQIVLGATGGFLLSFPLLALAAGVAATQKNKAFTILWLLGGAAVNYLCGMVMFALVLNSTLGAAFLACVLPYLVFDLIKLVAAAVLGEVVKTALIKAKVLA